MMKKLFTFFLLTALFSSSLAQAPATYYNGTAGLTGAALKTKLHQIISTGAMDNGYGGLWTAYATTDIDLFYENDGTIFDMYSENPTGPDPYNFTLGTDQCGQYSVEGDCYNREHIVPQSLFGSASPMKNDVHFIRATDGKVNGERANYPFGMVGTPTFVSLNGSKVGNSVSPGFSGTVFEPINAYKGDVARMVLYFVTRYESQLSTFSTGNNMLGGTSFPGLTSWELQQMLLWNSQDAISPEEIARNNASYTFQGNRNPFIDNAQYANDIWGAVVIDTVPPTTPANLVAANPTSSTVDLTWTASTDNVAVAGYDIYANGIFKNTVSGVSTTVNGLSASTAYSFYVIAKDTSGNSSPQSNTATETTLAGTGGGSSCGTEDFENIPNGGNGYGTRTWTNNAIDWTATDARTDQTINGKAITIRNAGTLVSSTISGGVQSVTVTTQRVFGGGSGTFNLRVNGNTIGSIPFSSTATTTTISNINVTGDVIFSITDNSNGDRVAIDDFTWTCGSLSTTEMINSENFRIYPNPVSNGILNVQGNNLEKITSAEIYDANGKVIQKIEKPFSKGNRIILNKIPAGLYILKTSEFSVKFLVK